MARAAAVGMLIVAGFALAGCNFGKPRVVQRAEINNTTKFSQAEYGVKASPRVTEEVKVAKGGGKYIVGKPYRVRGKWYKPRENPSYAASGIASWYGPNFHGRLTANGEIYDQYGLSAAHPTLPLPSYARVTNLENGRSVMVRINDRGPYAHGRIIDLSARAAKLLDYTQKGVAKVRVEYAGKARIDGHDEAFLLASYRGPDAQGIVPGGTEPGTLIALNESEQAVGSPAAADEVGSGEAGSGKVGAGGFDPPGIEVIYSGSVELASVPIPLARPTNFDGIAIEVAQGIDLAEKKSQGRALLQPLGFAGEAQSRIVSAFAALEGETRAGLVMPNLGAGASVAELAGQTVVISLGKFADPAHAEFLRSSNSDLGLLSVRRSWTDRGETWEVRLLCGADVAPQTVDLMKGRGLAPRIVAQ